jgi:hypothetical protein
LIEDVTEEETVSLEEPGSAAKLKTETTFSAAASTPDATTSKQPEQKAASYKLSKPEAASTGPVIEEIDDDDVKPGKPVVAASSSRATPAANLPSKVPTPTPDMMSMMKVGDTPLTTPDTSLHTLHA